MHHAGNLLRACEYDLARRVSSIKTQISDTVKEQLLKVEKRKEELMSEGEFRKMELDERQDYFRKSDKVAGALQHIRAELTRALRHEDLVKMHPHSIQLLTEASSDIIAKTSSILQRRTFTCKKPSELQEHFGVMGQVVDNTDIHLSCCSFPRPEYVAFAGEPFSVKALVRNSQGQALSEAALKVSSIQIWATRIEGGFSPAAPVLVPISGYSKGEVRAHVQCTEAAVFLLEIRLDSPRPLPKLQGYELIDDLRTCSPLNAKLLVYGCRSITFGDVHSSPKGFIRPCLSYSIEHIAYTHVKLRSGKLGRILSISVSLGKS
eukprot:scpid80625/ scgid19787/ 